MPGLAASNLTIIALEQVQAALAYLAAGHPVDGVLLDLTNPTTEGLNSFQALQTQAPNLPMIVLVSPAQTSLGLEAVRAGAEDYLIKGQTPIAELWRAVGCALERHRRQRAIAPTHSPKNDLDTVAWQNQRYQKIFQDMPVSLWEEDWSAVMALVRDLQRQGITDFATYIDQHPEFVTLAMQRVQILDINQTTLDIFKAQTKTDILGSLETVFSTFDTMPGFTAELTAFCLGKPTFETEKVMRTVTGELIHAWVKTTFPDWQSGSSQVLVSLLDISERVQLEAERRQAEMLLTTRIRQQEAVAQLGLAATGADRLEPILQQATEQVAAVLDVEFCTILELTEDGSQLQLVAGVGWHPDSIDTVTIPIDQASQSRLTLRSPDPIYVTDMSQETRFSATPVLNDYGIVSGMSVAIRVQGEPWGVLGAHSRHPRQFSTDDTYFVQSVAALLALVIERVATQAALEESHQQMQTAQRIAALGGWEYDMVNDRLCWSEACKQAAGIAPEQAMLTCDDFLRHIHPDDLEMVLGQFEQASRDGQRPAPQGHRTPLDYEHRWICPSGEVRHLHQRGEIIHDASGHPLRVVGTLQNVTERARLETVRREIETTLRQQATLLINAERISQMGSWSTDVANNRLVWSMGTYRLFGLPPDHQIENFEQFLERVLPEDRPKLLAAQRQAEESTGIVEAEYRIRRPDGEIRWLAERGNVDYDAAGRPIRRSGMVMDITAQKAAEATLRASEERFRLVARATNDAIWDWDIVANTTWRGEGFKTLFGYSDADLKAPSDWWHNRLHPEDRHQVLASLQTALEGDATIWKEEYRFRRPDSSYAYVMNRSHIIRNAQGQAIRIIGGVLNLTEQKNLEAQLLQSQKMEAIGQLTGGMAHDFNNLLTVILGNADLLVEQLDSHPSMRSLADMIAVAAQRGADLTQRLLSFARRQTLDSQPVDVNQLIASMHGLLRRTLGEQIEVRCSCDDHLWPALVDAAQLESALLNLCINARDAMDGAGCLTLTTAQVNVAPEDGDRPDDLHPGDYVMVTVSDTGVGMATDLLSRAFEPFFTTKAKDKGTGLGLSMVYSFVCQSNGHIIIDSEPGVGTTVRLYLPRCGDRQRLALEGDTQPEAVIPGGDSELILLVEDNTLVRDYARQQIESLGYRVLVAETGPTALEMLQQQPEIDLLFTDVLMPGGLNGRELAAAAHRLRPHLRVLYTSGYSENILTHREGPEAEIPLLHKPYQRAELAHKIRQALTDG
ncbi:PAS domain-containing protein [Leptolyngbya sp. CCNP1308]|uniref:PAS domain-containing protein n=1 Tax=Leptolyngbya sp. CCNP1308 TaxID=3110255 RepID=UPI002B2050CC|nr:PAS domain-containing protein [Leptolyngbya sp. CCNP1308]MEA5451609.1 PAS domain-containing protein [Leptolyngbya sp. CCNP1308]